MYGRFISCNENTTLEVGRAAGNGEDYAGMRAGIVGESLSLLLNFAVNL